MRPLSLSMSAFGPYAGTQVLDFSELGDKRFFLVNGPTGAGKTSILDAITFALYGDTSGDERVAADMRSQFAEPHTLTEVTFDFAVGSETYRVWRRPAQQRPKLRGAGFTPVTPDATLFRLPPGFTGNAGDDAVIESDVLASGVRDVNGAVEGLLGFSSDQFRQVVLLPQGRFREVLSADVRQREEILRQLFRTDRFASITEFMKVRRNELNQAMKSTQDRRSGVLEAAGVESREELETRHAEAAEALKVADVAREQAVVVATAARKALDDGKAAAEVLREAVAAEDALKTIDARKPEIDSAREELNAARKAQAVEAADKLLAAREGDEVGARAALETAEAALPAAETAFAKACTLLEEAEAAGAEVREIDRLEKEVAEASRQADDLDALATAVGDLATADGALERARQAAGACDEALAKAKIAADQAEAAWRAGQAAVLASTLAVGAPCPVCGSTDHPVPAAPHEGAPTESELEVVRSAVEAARTAQASAQAGVARCEEAQRGAAKRVGEQHKRLGKAAELDRTEVRTNAAQLANRVAELHKERVKAEKALATCRASKEAAQKRQTQATVVVETARTALGVASEAVANARSDFEAALAEAGFESADVYRVVRRAGAEIDRLESLVSSFDGERTSARNRVERARDAAKLVKEAPDLLALAAACETAEEAARQAEGEWAAANKDTGRWKQALDTLDELERQAAGLYTRYALVGRLADVACGDNPLRLSFQRYMLGTYLDEVLDHASFRLVRMTGGRYRLQRKSVVGDARRAAGLELEVFDETAGEARPASTLSGGEGFLASLALALGLAEAVQAHAGGVRLETIFIDEGFGSLDPQALDEAIDTLLDLASGTSGTGRLVGVISHVPELRQRIDCRLEVTPGRRGSTARFVT